MYTNPHRDILSHNVHPTKMRRYCQIDAYVATCQTVFGKFGCEAYGAERNGRAKRPVCDINIDFSEPLGGLRY